MHNTVGVVWKSQMLTVVKHQHQHQHPDPHPDPHLDLHPVLHPDLHPHLSVIRQLSYNGGITRSYLTDG